MLNKSTPNAIYISGATRQFCNIISRLGEPSSRMAFLKTRALDEDLHFTARLALAKQKSQISFPRAMVRVRSHWISGDISE